MTTHKEALTLALEALKYEPINKTSGEKDLKDQAITAIKEALAKLDKIAALQQKTESHDVDCLCSDCAALDDLDEALAQPEQEPVAHVCVFPLRGDEFFPQTRIEWKNGRPVAGPLYTTPPQRTWVGLTDEEILSWWSRDNDLEDLDMCNIVHFRKVIEEVQAKLKRKNT